LASDIGINCPCKNTMSLLSTIKHHIKNYYHYANYAMNKTIHLAKITLFLYFLTYWSVTIYL
jgi:hypothetical protein